MVHYYVQIEWLDGLSQPVLIILLLRRCVQTVNLVGQSHHAFKVFAGGCLLMKVLGIALKLAVICNFLSTVYFALNCACLLIVQ